MKTYIPVYQRKIDYETGEELFDANGVPVMEVTRVLIVKESPINPSIPGEQPHEPTIIIDTNN
jgi:hypothetical protein